MAVSSGPAVRVCRRAGLLVPLSSCLREVNLEEAGLQLRMCVWERERAKVQSSCSGCVVKVRFSACAGIPVSVRWLANEAVSKRRGSRTQPRAACAKRAGPGEWGRRVIYRW